MHGKQMFTLSASLLIGEYRRVARIFRGRGGGGGSAFGQWRCKLVGGSGGMLPWENFRIFGLPWTTFRVFSWWRKRL